MTYNQKIPPFKWFILENFPYIEEDFDALTNWQLFCKLGKEMNKIIQKCNLTGEQVEQLTNAFNSLQTYVDNYFENLDIQEEVNTKLDEMAESGELADLIAQYLEAQAIIGFNTNSSLAEATNLGNGSFARTYGKTTYNDGKGAFYKIRTRTNADVPDGDTIIVLTETENLVAEKMPDYRMNQVETRVTNLENQSLKKWLFVGDSYSQGYSPDGQTTSWSTQLKSMLGLTDDNCTIADYGGASFANSGAYLYNTILNNLDDDSELTDILIAGGYNDITQSKANILSGIATVKQTCSTKFPNAKIHCAFIGGCITEWHGNIHLCEAYYQDGFTANNIDYWPNLEYIMTSVEYFASDGIHPNQSGQNKIAKGLYQALLQGGYSYSRFSDLVLDVSQSDMVQSTTNMPFHLYSQNSVSYLAHYDGVHIFNALSNFNIPTDRYINLGKLQYQYGIVGTRYYSNLLLDIGNVIIWTNSDGYFNTSGKITINKDGYVLLYIDPLINDTHNNYQALNNIRQIQLPNFSICYPTLAF